METIRRRFIEPEPLIKRLHIRFFKYFLQICPSSLSESDCNRVTIAHFSLGGLDMLNALDTLSEDLKKSIIEWIYHLQVLPITSNLEDSSQICGFQGTSTSIVKDSDHYYEAAHLAQTYSALCCLLTLGDDLSRVNKNAVIDGVRKSQLSSGHFEASRGTEGDMRFVFCAASICYILNDFRGIDLDRMVNYIKDSISYDGGVGQGPGRESHGGSTFCAVAALHLTHTAHRIGIKQWERLKRWCILRQQEGFQGRPNKPEDTCYSFWVGGTLAILNVSSWIDRESNRDFVMSTQDTRTGGFAKWPDSQADPIHAFMGLAGLSLQEEEGVSPVDPRLCITVRAHEHLKKLHGLWS